MGWIDIISGHVDEALGKNEDLSEKRLAVCKECPLYKETPMGPICNPRLYINEIIKQTIQIDQKLDIEKDADVLLIEKQNCLQQNV